MTASASNLSRLRTLWAVHRSIAILLCVPLVPIAISGALPVWHDGTARSLPDPLAGDRAARWIRFIHDGSRGGIVWQAVVFLTGVFPPIFAVTGIVMWLRRRRSRAASARSPVPGVMQAAE